MSLRRVDDVGMMATFSSAFACMDRVLAGAPENSPVYVEARDRSAKQLVPGVTNKNYERDAAIVAEWKDGKTARECAEGRGISADGVRYIIRRDVPPAERAQIGAAHRAIWGFWAAHGMNSRRAERSAK